MKKIICGLSALAMMAAPMTAFAANPITESTEQSGKVTISTEIAPAYIVTIPADTKVKFNDTVTDFGKIELTEARLEPGKVVAVDVYGDFEMKNSADESKTIFYDVIGYDDMDGTDIPEYSFIDSDYFTEVKGHSVRLRIEIDDKEWNNAPAGSYSDVLTFLISYKDDPDMEQSEEDNTDTSENGE